MGLLFSANLAVVHLVPLEPRLLNAIDKNDALELRIQPDSQGRSGDVRDLVMLRKTGDWEIGISAKHHHKALKHPRLSNRIDFGEKWLGFPCSQNYFSEICPIFNKLAEYRKKGFKWEQVDSKEDTFYAPILRAFTAELKQLLKAHKSKASKALLEYLLGRYDFYKVIKMGERTEIQAFNIHEKLNQPFRSMKPIYRIPRTKLPEEIVNIQIKEDNKTTATVYFDNGWTISFRLHNASSRVEASFKFDIQIVGLPDSIYRQQLYNRDEK